MLLALGGCLVGLLLVEFVLRTCDPFDYAGIEERERLADVLLSFDGDRPHLVPGVRTQYRERLFAINSEGLRNREVSRDRSSEEFRILVLGGSVPFGWGVRETDCFPRLIERALNEDSNGGGPDVEVVNAAVPGYGLHRQLQQLDEIGQRYAPDMVLVPVMWSDVPRHRSQSSRRRFLSPAVRRTFRTLRLAEILFMKVMGDDPADEFHRPGDLDPRGLREVCFGLGLFKEACDRLGARMIVLDALGIDSLHDTCERLGLIRMPLQTTLDWLDRHRISDRDAHPNERGHRRIAELVVRNLTDEIPR
jgi:hypothetical protein